MDVKCDRMGLGGFKEVKATDLGEVQNTELVALTFNPSSGEQRQADLCEL